MVLSKVSREVFQFLAFMGPTDAVLIWLECFWNPTGQEWSSPEAVFSLIDVVRSFADGVACGDALKKAEHRTPCITPPMERRLWNIL
jgi:hypothetical protein